jgi:hypothetical protein
MQIVQALRGIGASVQVLNAVKQGCPDLLVGYHGVNFLLEVKDGEKPTSKQKLTSLESKWHFEWHGTVCIVRSIDDAIEIVTGVPF